MQQQRRAQQQMQKTTLYRVVFENRVVKYAVVLMFTFLVIQPVAPAFASEDSNQVETLAEDHMESLEIAPTLLENNESSPETDTQVFTEDLEVSSEVQSLDSEETDLYEAVVLSENVVGYVPFNQNATTTEDGEQNGNAVITNNQTETENDVSTETDSGDLQIEIIDDSTSSTTTIVVSDDDTASSTYSIDIVEETAISEVDEVLEDVVIDTPATSSMSVVQPEIVAHNASAFAFDSTQCTTVGDGAYYCSDKKATTTLKADGVYSAPDSDGDLEIYIRVAGVESQVTHNTYDDASPHYDAHSNTIVWHSYIQDRYQIISYDIATDKMLKLTNTSYNNMEPMVYENIILWQAWIDSNWEIMLFDGTTLQQLTNNTIHDVSPHMKDDYVVWQTQFTDGWQVAVYDQDTKHIEYIPSEDGVKVENPRFVLVYDSTDKNGDMQTLGYDFDSKTSFELGRLPQELPQELPEPDQTGETRALLQSKQTAKEGELESVGLQPEPGTVPASTTAATASSTSLTLDLSLGEASSTVSAAFETVQPITDIVIESYTSATSASQGQFATEDLVIPPFTATTSSEVR